MEGETFIKMNFDFRKNSTCLIASYENIKKIRNNFIINDSNRLKDLLRLQKYILLDKTKDYNILDDDFNIKSELLDRFPYLENILKLVISMKLTFNLTEEDIYKIVLDNIKNDYIDSEKMKQDALKIINL